MKTCEILVTREQGQVVAGTVSLRNGKVTTKPEKGFQTLMKNVIQNPHIVNDRRVSLNSDAEAWFDSLPSHYNGSRVRARLL